MISCSSSSFSKDVDNVHIPQPQFSADQSRMHYRFHDIPRRQNVLRLHLHVGEAGSSVCFGRGAEFSTEDSSLITNA